MLPSVFVFTACHTVFYLINYFDVAVIGHTLWPTNTRVFWDLIVTKQWESMSNYIECQHAGEDILTCTYLSAYFVKHKIWGPQRRETWGCFQSVNG